MGYLATTDDLVNFWQEPIKNQMADGGHFENKALQKSYEYDML